MNKILLVILFFLIGHILIWIQTNGQFLWRFFEKNPILLSFTFGGVISYFFIMATKYSYQSFDELVWPGRFIGFAVGIVSYAIMTYLLLNEGVTTKTLICLVLSLLILTIQLLWK
tara:strand:+ start:396 stop:740 length:345 start_codon:yes stop_codon:yes gene_type:complete